MRFDAPLKRGPNPYRGILWAAVVGGALLIMAYGGAYFLKREHQKDARTKRSPTPSREAEPVRIKTGHEIKPPDKDQLSPVYTDPSSLTEDAVASEAIDTRGFYYALYQLKDLDPAKLAAEAKPAPPPDKIKSLKPGTPLSLEGTVVRVDTRKEYADPAAGITEPGQYEIKDAGGHLYLVFTTYTVRGVEAGDRVKLVGWYLRMYAYVPYAPLGQTHMGEPTPTPVLIARVVDSLEDLDDPACLKTVIDDVKGHEPKPFYHLVHRVGKLSQAELKRRADLTLTPEDLLEHPAAARGRHVRIDGAFIAGQRHDKMPNVAHVDRLYWSIIRTEEGPAVWAFTLEEPIGIQRGEGVRVYGIFLKKRWYTSRQGYEPKALVVVGRRLVRVAYGEPPNIGVTAVVIGLVTVMVLFLAVLWERNRSRKFSRHVHDLAARSRPGNLNAAAKQASVRAAAQRAAPSPLPDSDGEHGAGAPPDRVE